MNDVLILGLLLVLGLLSTRLTRLIKLPNVTGFLLIGLLSAGVCILVDYLGYKSSFHPESLAESLSRLNRWVSNIALGFIALSIGEEFRLKQIKQYGGKMALITVFQSLTATFLVDAALVVVCLLFHANVAIAIILGAIATATAPAATLMVIHQYKAKGPLVDTLLPVVAFDDAIGLIVFSISLAISHLFMGGEISLVSMLAVPMIEIFGSLALGFLLGLAMHGLLKIFASRNNHTVMVIAFTLLGVGACEALNHIQIAGESLSFSSLLCCMMIGAVYINFAKEKDRPIITRDLEVMDRWTPFLFTLFFVLSGAHLATSFLSLTDGSDSKVLIFALVVFAVYLVMRSLGKYLGAFSGCKLTHQENHITHYLGLALLPQAGVAIGMANQISANPSFTKDNVGSVIVTVVLLATLVYELVGPSITKWALKKAGEIPLEETK